MNRALIPTQEVTREEVENIFGGDLKPDMAQMDESELSMAELAMIARIRRAIEEKDEERRANEGGSVAYVFLAIGILIACLIGLSGCTDTVERSDLAPLTSIRPEPRP